MCSTVSVESRLTGQLLQQISDKTPILQLSPTDLRFSEDLRTKVVKKKSTMEKSVKRISSNKLFANFFMGQMFWFQETI